jgi:hypothetical protein
VIDLLADFFLLQKPVLGFNLIASHIEGLTILAAISSARRLL